jgi:hypothetical protein
MDLQKLMQRREKLAAALRAVDAKIAQAKRKQEAAATAELAKLVRQHGLTPEQLKALLAGAQKQQNAGTADAVA